MTLNFKLSLTALSLCLFTFISNAQLSTTAETNADNLVTTLIGNGADYVAGTATVNCPGLASGTFDGTASNIGINNGILLSTGSIQDFTETNDDGASASQDNGVEYEDADLMAIEPNAKYDVCILEFDIIPTCDTLMLDYVFASEEYPEYVCSSFNDAFGFFISGPGINGPFANGAQNIAVVPGVDSSNYVAINTINGGTAGSGLFGPYTDCPGGGLNNTQYYVDNTDGTTVEFDGFTVPLTAQIGVQPCETYHMKLIIADSNDGILDSGVFLAESGLTCPPATITWQTSIDTTLEGCSAAEFTLIRDGDIYSPLPVTFTFLGGAGQGMDYNFPTDFTFAIQDTEETFTITANDDNTLEGFETFSIVATIDICGELRMDTIDLVIQDEPFAEAGEDQFLCDPLTTLTADSPAPYTGLWTDPSGVVYVDNTSPTTDVTFPGPGDYTLTYTVTAIPGCDISDNVNITVYDPFIYDLTITEPLCYGDPLTVSVNNNPGSATFTWSFSGVATGSTTGDNVTINYSSDGTVNIDISTLVNGCPYDTTIAATVPPALAITETHTDISCNGTCDGTIDAVVTGGTPIYTYNWGGQGDAPTSASNTGLCVGDYHLDVTDANGCLIDLDVSITEPSALSGFLNATDVTVNGNCDGSITSTISGGSTPYTYAWDNGSSDADITNGCVGTYCLTVTDANGCTLDLCDSIQEPPPIDITLVTTHVDCYQNCNGQIELTIDGGGVPPYTINWTHNGGTESVDQLTLSDLCAQEVTLVVSDVNGATVTEVITVTEPSELVLSETHTDIDCFGDCDATGEVSIVSGGTSPFTYDWNGVGDTPTANTNSSLCAGTHTVNVTDANNCLVPINVIVATPDSLGLTETHVDMGCTGACDGSIDVTVFGGTTPYVYTWDNGDVGEDLADLCSGDYHLDVADANGCALVLDVTINEPTPLSLTTSTVPSNCGQADGEVSVQTTGGSGVYFFAWTDANDNAIGTTETITGLVPGNYCVVVSDNSGCIDSICVDLNDAGGGSLTLSNETHNTCFASCDGSFDAAIVGGTAPYVFDLTLNGASVDNQNSTPGNVSFSTLCAGDYTVLVTDDVGCVTSSSMTITEPEELVIVVTDSTSTSCANTCDGEGIVQITGGTLPYVITWSENSVNDTINSALCAGNHTVTVTDANGCTANVSFEITSPDAIDLSLAGFDLSCFESCDGQVIVIPSGGTVATNYTISWINSMGQTISNSASTEGLCAGEYVVIVQDDMMCEERDTITINEPNALSVTFSQTSANCNQADGALCVDVNGGTPPYSYSWVDDGGNVVGTDSCLVDFEPGNYCLTVTDANDCEIMECSEIENIPGPEARVTLTVNTLCYESCEGEIHVEMTGGQSTNFTYYISSTTDPNPTLTNNPMMDLCADDYTIMVTDDAGCIAYAYTTVQEPTPVIVTGLGDTTICQNGCATVAGLAEGGTPPYLYAWDMNTIGQIQTYCPGQDTTVMVLAMDNNGCMSEFDLIDITLNPGLNLSISVIGDDVVCPGETVMIDAVASGGSGNGYTFYWAPDPVNMQSPQSPPVEFLPSGATMIYAAVIDDCETDPQYDSVLVDNFNVPEITFETGDVTGCEPLTVDLLSTISPAPASLDWWFTDGAGFDESANGLSTQVNFNNFGNYDMGILMVTADNCVDTVYLSNYFEVYENPIADFSFGPQPTTMLKPNITFDASNSYIADYYNWSFGDGDTTDGVFVEHFYEGHGNFETTLMVETMDGCTDEITKTVVIEPDFVIYVPNAFTPDGDGKNEIFIPQGFGLDIGEYQFEIFDRWGNLIFETNDVYTGWDGKVHNCSGCPSIEDRLTSQIDVYVWKVKYKDHKNKVHKFVGHVTVIR